VRIGCSGSVLIGPLPSNGRLFCLHYSAYQASGHSIISDLPGNAEGNLGQDIRHLDRQTEELRNEKQELIVRIERSKNHITYTVCSGYNYCLLGRSRARIPSRRPIILLNLKITPCHVPTDNDLHSHRHENLKSRLLSLYLIDPDVSLIADTNQVSTVTQPTAL
jgi:hypothetical protein